MFDEHASDSDDEKRIYRAERRAGRKINKEKRRRVRSDEKGSGSSSVLREASSSRFSSKDLASRSEARPARRLRPCFKISNLLFLVTRVFFLPRRLWRYTQAIIKYSPSTAVLLYVVLETRLVQNIEISAVRSLADI